MKYLVLLVICMLSVQLNAQISNTDFELGKSDTLSHWHIQSGLFSQSSAYTFPGSNGDTTVKATSGSYFGKMQNEGDNEGNATNSFDINYLPKQFSLDFIYLFNDFRERFGIEIAFTKWNQETQSRDTVAKHVEFITGARPNGLPRTKWFTFKEMIDGKDIRILIKPDTCQITIRNDAGIIKANATTLLIDNIVFSGSTAIDEEMTFDKSIISFPNPCNTRLFLKMKDPTISFTLFNVQGVEVLGGNYLEAGIDVEQINEGVYILQIRNRMGIQTSKVQIIH